VTRFLAEFSFELKSLEGKLNDLSRALETQTSETEMIKRGAVSEIEEQRETLIRQFRLQVTSLHESIVRSVQNWNRQVSTARDTLRRQAAAVGISL
jgi:vacuolar-type H+-ATPase subunit E/Vma4